MRKTTVTLAGLLAAPLLFTTSPAQAHVPGVTTGPVKAGCSDASVQPVRRNARGQLVEQYLLRATVTSPSAHTHVVDRQLRVSNAHTGKLSGWRTVRENIRIACGRGSGSSEISGTVSAMGSAWK